MKDYERVSVNEAIELTGKQSLSTLDYVEEVVMAAAKRQAAMFPTQSASFNLMLGALTAYEAGRVAGIRAERERRKTGKHIYKRRAERNAKVAL